MSTASSRTEWALGWNGPKATKEPGLNIYVASDGTVTPYFKGRLLGKVTSVQLHGANLTEWRNECRVLRGDKEAARKVVGNRRITVVEYAETHMKKQWLRVGCQERKQRRSRKSVQNDQQRIDNFLVGTKLGRMKLGDVDVQDLREYVADLKLLKQDNGKLYANNTLRDVTRVLGALFREAAKDGLIPRNVMLEFPRDERPSSEAMSKKRYLDTDQIDALLAEVGDTFRPILILCAYAGLRVSEAIGIVWGDLDLDAGTLSLVLQLDGSERVDLKTKNSEAVLDLMPEVVAALKTHKKTMQERGLQYVRKDGLVFVTEPGKPQSPQGVWRALRGAADRAGLNSEKGVKKVDIHSLRHSFVSNGLASGMTITEMAMLARQNPITTASVYSDVPETQRKAAAKKLAVALGR